MTATETIKQNAGGSPLPMARIAGICWLTTIVAGIVGMSVGESIIVSNDAAATATNILANKSLFQLGTAANLVATASYMGATVFIYGLLKPVNGIISLLAAFFSLVGCAVGAVSSLFGLAPFVVLGGTQYINVFTAEQTQALALLFLQVFSRANNIALVFFGLHCVFVGYLVFKSTFIPRPVGILMMFGGMSWMTFLIAPLASYLAPYNMGPGAIGEISLSLWLIVRGVNVRRWKDMNDRI